MNINDTLTLVTACDRRYLAKLNATLPTWRKVKGWTGRIVVFVNGWTHRSLAKSPAFAHLRGLGCTLVKWEHPPAETQREKMLSAFIFGVARHVTTEYHCKLDAETVAYKPGPWYEDNWFGQYAIIAPRWGYTKPGVMVERIDYWMNGLCRAGKLPIPVHIAHPEKYYEVWKGPKDAQGNRERQIRWYVEKGYKYSGPPENWRKQKHGARRICSWIKFMRTSVARSIADALPLGRLVSPSEDTTAWRWCHNLDLPVHRVNFKALGWFHRGKDWKQWAEKAMREYEVTQCTSPQ